MRHFSLLIGNETRGPLTEQEITDLIGEGKVTADTPCAPAGAQEWTPLSAHFPFPSKLKVRSGKDDASETETQAAASRIDPDLRKKLLAYGLADAATIDGFTLVQARRAVAAHEDATRQTLRRYRLGGLAALGTLALGGLVLGLTEQHTRRLLAYLSSPVIKDDVRSREQLHLLRNELADFAALKAQAEGAVFARPEGGEPGLNLLARRLNLDPAASFAFRGQADFAPLARALAARGLRLEDDRRVGVFRQPADGSFRDLLARQVAAFEQSLASGTSAKGQLTGGKGGELAGAVLIRDFREARLKGDGPFSVEPVPSLTAETLDRVLVRVRVDGETIFLPWGHRLLGAGFWRSETTTSGRAVDGVRCKVAGKTIVGGRTYQARLNAPDHTYVVTRVAPRWHFVALTRDGDKARFHALVDEDTYARARVGEPLPLAALMRHSLYEEVAESPRPAGLLEP
jgi:hypothetical protein